MNKNERRLSYLTMFVVTSVIVSLVVIAYALTVPQFFSKPPGSAAEFGDMFGAINALFSALAFAGVVCAMLMQQHELRFQFQELQDTRKAMESAADAHKATVEMERLNATPLLKCTGLRVENRKSGMLDCEITVRNCGGVAIEPYLYDFRTEDEKCGIDYAPLIPKDETQTFSFRVMPSDKKHMKLELRYNDRFYRQFAQTISVDVCATNPRFLSTQRPKEVDPEPRLY